ncbi:hypothetical protein R8Z50_21645 [Longispora sp. K20-0274]|uniref:hypothetical protein n=1 Tax=Longispora sp. K20-0274 TaxID=3088255 RepID=UPI00399AABAC
MILVVGVVLLSCLGGLAVTRDAPAAPAPAAVPTLCRNSNVHCGELAGPVRYAVIRAAGRSAGLVLVEAGGPGLNALDRLDRDTLGLPNTLSGYDLLLIDEPWVGRPAEPGCAGAVSAFVATVLDPAAPAAPSVSAACSPASWTAADYTAALDGILTREGRTLTGIVGQSFGALPASAAALRHPGAWLVLNAPIAPPGTPGDTVLGDRTEAVRAALTSSYATQCAALALDCARTGPDVVADAARRTTTRAVTGRSQPLTSGDVGVAALAATYGLAANERWLWPTLSRFPDVSDDDALQLGRLSDQLLQRYGRGQVATDLAAFVTTTCRAYRGWSEPPGPTTMLTRIAGQCARDPGTASGWAAAPRPSRTCVYGNETDPVAPGTWADGWAQRLGVPAAHYRHAGHASLATAVKLTPGGGCAAGVMATVPGP